RCVECSIDPGVPQGCANGEACPSGTVCSNTVCCPAGTCGWGEGQWFTRHCAKNGDYRENRWARLVCRNGVWKTELNGWGCNAFTCDQGTCQDNLYCAYSLPLNPSSQMHETGAYCAGTCKSCSAQGKNCGIVSDQCGGYIYCGACASGQTCNASGQCVSSCTPATCLSLGKLCGVWNDNCGGTVNCGSCLADEFCNASGQCVASCVPATCSSLGKLCGVWNDNCGGTVNCGSCLAGQSCNISGQCVADDSGDVDCTPNFSKKCADGHLYWYDSCGAKEGMAQNCGTDSATQNFQCRGNWVQQEIITRDCANGACTENKSWSDSVNCALSGKICAAGVCVANDITPPSLFGLSPSGTIYSANVALTVSTNEVSECRYGLQDMSFTSMALKFGSSNKTYHSASIILPSPGNYNYFVRCADTAGNAATASAKISFVYALPAQSPAVTETPPSSPVLPPVSDKTPPVISDALPAGDVFEGKVQISVTTDEKSSCKYDIAATDYDSMENFLESDGTGTFHSKEISISAAGNYAYYVNCKDDAGNEAGQSTAIKFNYVQGESGPAISEIAPEGAVYQGEIMLTAVTDVPAVCRYSGEDREFEEMTDLFSASDDGLRQSAMITLGDYGNYNYHIRCRDEKGNTQGSYAAVSFEYKDPAAPVSGEAPVSLECYQVADGDRDGECDHTLDCVCDPDCPVDGEDADPDCANVAVQESGTNRALFIGIGLLLLLVLIVIFAIIIMHRKKSGQENQDENEFA
ncbi:MAG TPA: hypothetical protein PKK37_03185, partial [Candidatus Pacearchaeota archaeon]|nr:hypothetical protein [Candidatus Pacearchaeota archaeon]